MELYKPLPYSLQVKYSVNYFAYSKLKMTGNVTHLFDTRTRSNRAAAVSMYNSEPCDSRKYNSEPCDSRKYNSVPSHSRKPNSVPCDSRKPNSVPWDSRKPNPVPWDSLKPNPVPCDSRKPVVECSVEGATSAACRGIRRSGPDR